MFHARQGACVPPATDLWAEGLVHLGPVPRPPVALRVGVGRAGAVADVLPEVAMRRRCVCLCYDKGWLVTTGLHQACATVQAMKVASHQDSRQQHQRWASPGHAGLGVQRAGGVLHLTQASEERARCMITYAWNVLCVSVCVDGHASISTTPNTTWALQTSHLKPPTCRLYRLSRSRIAALNCATSRSASRATSPVRCAALDWCAARTWYA